MPQIALLGNTVDTLGSELNTLDQYEQPIASTSEIIQATNSPTSSVTNVMPALAGEPTGIVNNYQSESITPIDTGASTTTSTSGATTPTCGHYTFDLSGVPQTTYVTLSWRDCAGQPQMVAGYKSTMGDYNTQWGTDFNAVYNPPLGTSVISPNPVDVVPTATEPATTTTTTTTSGTSNIAPNPVDVVPTTTQPTTTGSVTISGVPLLGTGVGGILGSLGVLGGAGGGAGGEADQVFEEKENPTYWMYVIGGALVAGYILLSGKKSK